jgi:hypothetical protein
VKHFTEAELLETWFTPPGASLSAMLHVADCETCASRYARLESKFDALFTCPHPHARRNAAWRAAGAAAITLAVALSLAWRYFGWP